MADFFADDDNKDVVEETSDLIKIGEKEYSQDELSRLVELGEVGREAEEKFNTKIDKVWPEFSRSKNELKEAQERLERLEQEREEWSRNSQPETNLNEEEAIKAAKKLGLVTKDDFAEYQRQNYKKFYQEERAAERLLEESEGLSKKYDGSDGRPRYDTEAVLMYMQDNGVTKPETAYKLMHEDKLDEWRERKLGESKKSGLFTNRPGGNKVPTDVRPNSDNLEDLVREALAG